MILKLLDMKEFIKRLYEKHGIYIKALIKFVLALAVFQLINSKFGFNETIDNIVIVLGCSLIAALTPDAIFIILTALITAGHAYSVAPVLAVGLLFLYIIIYYMYIRYVPNQAFIILAIPFLYVLKVPYLIPLVCGIFFGPIAIISNVCGIAIYYVFEAIIGAAVVSEGTGVADTINFFNMVVDAVKSNRYMIFSMLVFSVVVLVTYIIRRSKIKQATNIAILTATLLNIVAFLLASAFIEGAYSIPTVLLGSIASGFMAYIAQFFRMSLDYSGTKHIQFEDDEYYYYVKAVPKLTVAAPEKQVVTIHAQVPNGNTANIQEIIEHAFDEDKDN